MMCFKSTFENVDFSTLPSPLPPCILVINISFGIAMLLPSALENEQRVVCVTLGHKLHFVMTQTEEVLVCVCPCMLGGGVNPNLSLSPSLSLYDSR